MARIVKPLNDTQIKQAKPREKEYALSDGSGLQLLIKPNGTKAWIFKYYKPYTKKRTNLSFGKYPHTTLAAARKKRDEARALLADEIDPKEYREQQYLQESLDRSNTLKLVAKKWFEIKRAEITDNYASDVWNSLERHIFPMLGDYPLSNLSAQQVIKVISPIAAKGSLETVKRLCQRLNEIMVFAVNTGVIHHNNLAGIRAAFQKPVKTSMPTIEPSRLPEFMEALSRASIKFTTRCLIEWQLHTMVRPYEAATAEWEDIDFENQLWVIPAEKMKMKRGHKIPLTPSTLRLLELLKPVSGHRQYIFPADRNPRTHMNTQSANAAIKRMGFKGQLVAHGLRALASTTLNESKKFDSDLIEACLAHNETNEVRAAYNRAEYVEHRRELMSWWSDFINEAKVKAHVR
jgi:integrase